MSLSRLRIRMLAAVLITAGVGAAVRARIADSHSPARVPVHATGPARPSLAVGATSRSARPGTRVSSRYLTGIADNNPAIFASPHWTRLKTRIVRYVAPYDAVTRRKTLAAATAFIRAAEAAHQEVLVAFYHSNRTPTVMPSVGTYQHDVQKFVKRFARIRRYESWDESNRGNVPHAFSSPSAPLAARYYQALIRVCRKCTVIGLDMLDGQYLQPALTYISEFRGEIGKLKTLMPRVWGLHNYVDLNHYEDWRTRQLVKVLGGEVWLTETGGIVKFANVFSNDHGKGLTRAAGVLKYMFRVASAIPGIKRLYIYNWTGSPPNSRWDSGLTNRHLQPRIGWLIVCRTLHASPCLARISKT
jgi:hypothetical protein